MESETQLHRIFKPYLLDCCSFLLLHPDSYSYSILQAGTGLLPVPFNTSQFVMDYKSVTALNDHYLYSLYFLNIPLSNGVHKHAFRFAFLRPLFAQVLQVKNKPYFPFAS
jgi:hypothetical protein